jgi:glycerate-2-kinase
LAVARRCGVPEPALRALQAADENPRADDPRLARGSYRILASPETLADEAAKAARAAGLTPRPRPALVADDVDDFVVELFEVGATLAPGECFVAVGEPTMRVRGQGLGGRAQHVALAMVGPLAGRALTLVALGSDGRDGPTDAAGAVIDGRALDLLANKGIDPVGALRRCDSHRALAAIGATVPSWPTGTNLTDLYLLGRA